MAPFLSLELSLALSYADHGSDTPDNFAQSCPPSFMAATCREVLGRPAPLYERLIEPSGHLTRHYKRTMKCWHPDKRTFHPASNTFIDEQFMADVRNLTAQCVQVMSMGKAAYYPRAIKNQDNTGYIDIQKSQLWNASSRDFNGSALKSLRSTEECKCNMQSAVRGLFQIPFTPPWSAHYRSRPPLPRTLPELVNYCHCDITTAWAPYEHIMDATVIPSIFTRALSKDWQIALGWTALRYGIVLPNPLAFALPRVINNGFRESHLPPRGAHDFWHDRSDAGLPRNSMDRIGVPDIVTNELRAWGLDGNTVPSDTRARLQEMSEPDRAKCIHDGWCSEETFKFSF